MWVELPPSGDQKLQQGRASLSLWPGWKEQVEIWGQKCLVAVKCYIMPAVSPDSSASSQRRGRRLGECDRCFHVAEKARPDGL
jgi:hypothetical protein